MLRFFVRWALALASAVWLGCAGAGAAAGPFSSAGDFRYVVFASRQNLDEAIGVARAYVWRFPNVRVLQSANGWYAVAAGPERIPDLRAYREQVMKQGGVARDFIFSRGDAYVAEVWKKTEPRFALQGEYDGERPATFSLGDLRVTLGRVKASDGDGFNPTAIGWRGNSRLFRMQFEEALLETPRSSVAALRLDAASPAPQIVFSAYSGGAHCCAMTKIAILGQNGWSVIDGVTQDGSGGYAFEDIDGDGVYELISVDDSFLYAFAPYAESRTPTRLWRLERGRLVEATRDPRLAAYNRQRVATFEHEAALDPDLWRSNGFLAAWVASKALVGQLDEAWARMLVSFDRSSDWPLTECRTPPVQGACPAGQDYKVSFPVALRLHLERNGYVPTAPRPPAAPVSAPEPATKKPEAKIVSGTGFFVSAEGHVVTNSHVVESCSTVVGRSASRSFPLQLLARDAANDLALLKADGVSGAPVTPLRANLRLGEPVAAFGFPLSRVLASSGNFTLGNVTALAGIGDDTRYLQISAPVQPGNSGGPLLDESGNLVGVVTAKLNALATVAAIGDVPQNVNFAIKASALAAFLESNRIALPTNAAAERLSPPDLADKANAIAVFLRCE